MTGLIPDCDSKATGLSTEQAIVEIDDGIDTGLRHLINGMQGFGVADVEIDDGIDTGLRPRFV